MIFFTFPPVNIDIPGVAQESTLQSIDTNIASLESKDFATQTTLAAVASDVSSLEAKDFATETTLAAASADIALLEAKDFATETTLAAASSDLNDVNQKIAASLVTESHDYISMTYVGATTDINTVTYKSGGSGGTIVATLTMAYDGSNRLTSVTKS